MTNYNSMTVAALKVTARELGVTGISKMRKAELIESIELNTPIPSVTETTMKTNERTRESLRAEYVFNCASKYGHIMPLEVDCGRSSQPKTLASLIWPDVQFYTVTNIGVAQWLAESEDFKFLYSDVAVIPGGSNYAWGYSEKGDWRMKEATVLEIADALCADSRTQGYKANLIEALKVLSSKTVNILSSIARTHTDKELKAIAFSLKNEAQSLLKPMRAIFVRVEDGEKLDNTVELYSKKGALNLAKYVKSLFGPMRGVATGASVSVVVAGEKPLLFGHAERLNAKPKDLSKVSALADGANLVSLSFAKRLVKKGSAFFVNKLKANMDVFTSFTGRLYTKHGLIKGQFIVVPDELLCLKPENGKKVWVDVFATEIKSEVKIADKMAGARVVRAFAFAANSTQTKIKPRVSTDLQKLLAGFKVHTPEFASYIQLMADASIARFKGSLDFQPAYSPLEADVLEGDDDYEGQMSTNKLLQQVKSMGFDPRAIPGLYVAMANQAADRNFDIARARLKAEAVLEGEPQMLAFDAYPATWVGAWLAELYEAVAPCAHTEYSVDNVKYSVGELVKFQPEAHTLYLGEKTLGYFPAVYTSQGRETVLDAYLNRRPSSFGSGSPVKVAFLPSSFPKQMRKSCWCAMDPDTFKAIFSDCDGGDQDDSYQIWVGRGAKLQCDLAAKKSEMIMSDSVDRTRFLSFMQNYVRGFFKRLSSDDKEQKQAFFLLERALKGINTISEIAKVYRSVEPACMHQDPSVSWPTSMAGSPCQAWVGTAANLDMLFMAALHGVVKFNCNQTLAEKAIKFSLGTMLSDIVDAEVQGKNIPAGADAMLSRQWAAAFIATLMIKEDMVMPTMAMPEIFERRLAFALGTFKDFWTDKVEKTIRLRDEDHVKIVEIPQRDNQGLIKRKYGKILPASWSLVDEMSRYIDEIIAHVDMELMVGSTGNHLSVIKKAANKIWLALDEDLRFEAEEAYETYAVYSKEYAQTVEAINELYGSDITSDSYKNEKRAAHKEFMEQIICLLNGDMTHTPGDESNLRYALAVYAWCKAPEYKGDSPSYSPEQKMFSIKTGSLSIIKLDDYDLEYQDDEGNPVLFDGLYREGIYVLQQIAHSVQTVDSGWTFKLANSLKTAKVVDPAEADAWVLANFKPGMSLEALTSAPGFNEIFAFQGEVLKNSEKATLRKKNKPTLDLLLDRFGHEPVSSMTFLAEIPAALANSRFNERTYTSYLKYAEVNGVKPIDENVLQASQLMHYTVNLQNVKSGVSANMGSIELLNTKVETLKRLATRTTYVEVGSKIADAKYNSQSPSKAALVGYLIPSKSGKPKLRSFEKIIQFMDFSEVYVAANSVWFVKFGNDYRFVIARGNNEVSR